jgi:tRNA A-37 threonylcarbamoyl transferase component Bud32
VITSKLNGQHLATGMLGKNLPVVLQLQQGEVLLQQVIRSIPRRRLIVMGEWCDKQVVIKIFIDKRRAKNHLEREAAGIKALQKNNIPSPGLYYEGTSADGVVQVLIFQRIADAVSVEEIWKNKKSNAGKLTVLKMMVHEIATQHVLGVLQHDMHLKNFLITEKSIFTLDGGQIEIFNHLLPRKESLKSLALFLAQLGVGMETLQESLFHYYVKLRGWILKPQDTEYLFTQIHYWNVKRWNKFHKKIFRKSTQFQPYTKWNYRGMIDRERMQPEMMQFLQSPDMIFQSSKSKMLKNGRSSTVIKVNLDGMDYVIKRYNMKNTWHWLRRCLRHTRARRAWQMAHKLLMFGVNTARPIAYLERHYAGLNTVSYFVTDYVSGGDIKHHLQTQREMIAATINLFDSLAKLAITHGDLKLSNFLVDEYGAPMLVDLDGVKEHATMARTTTAWRNEIDRFLANFNDTPTLQQQIVLALKNQR